MPPRIEISSGPSAGLNLPRATANPSGEALGEISETLYKANKAKKDIEDTIEANQLLSEHTIRAKELQSELLRTDLPEDQLLPAYTKQLEQLQEELIAKAKSSDVAQLLEQHIPNRNAGKLVEMSAESDRRFASKSMGEYESATVNDSVAYVSAASDAARQEVKGRHLRLIGIMKSTGVMDEVAAGRAEKKFLRSLDLFDAKKAIQLVPEMGILAITEPKKFLERFPGLTVEDLDAMFNESIQVQNQRYTLEQRRKKEVADETIKILDEAVIKGQVGLEDVTDGKTGKLIRGIKAYKDLISPEDYRRLLNDIEKRNQAGGFDDPQTKFNLKLRIQQNPNRVSEAEISSSIGRGLSADSAIDLLQYKETRRRQLYEQSSEVSPAFKGPLFQMGKSKIDEVIGKGGPTSGIWADPLDARRWSGAMDEYMERVGKETTKDQMTIANEVIEKYQKPDFREDIIRTYRNDKLPKKVDVSKLVEDYQKEKDPIKKRELAKIMKQLLEAKE